MSLLELEVQYNSKKSPATISGINTTVENWNGWLPAVIRKVVSPYRTEVCPFLTIAIDTVRLALLQEILPEMMNHPPLRFIG